ncbi:MAG: hypothetical protein GW855_14185 [Erythrobacter sp.]|nr:hypothetical protein [Erythrobacter sp.]NCQ64726.1 hypothetical protein [Alphaproteobacteria bacterium]
MAFSYDAGAYGFAQGLKSLSLMYQAAKNALEEQHSHFEELIDKYRKDIGSGAPQVGEWDEDGHGHRHLSPLGTPCSGRGTSRQTSPSRLEG